MQPLLPLCERRPVQCPHAITTLICHVVLWLTVAGRKLSHTVVAKAGRLVWKVLCGLSGGEDGFRASRIQKERVIVRCVREGETRESYNQTLQPHPETTPYLFLNTAADVKSIHVHKESTASSPRNRQKGDRVVIRHEKARPFWKKGF